MTKKEFIKVFVEEREKQIKSSYQRASIKAFEIALLYEKAEKLWRKHATVYRLMEVEHVRAILQIEKRTDLTE